MINNSIEKTVPISEKEAQQIKAVENRLLNLVDDVRTAEKNLSSIKQETEKAISARDYHVDLLNNTVASVKKAQEELHRLIGDSEKVRATIEDGLKVHQETERVHSTKGDELSKREDELKREEEAHSIRIADYVSKSNKLSEDQLLVEKAREAFLEATESVKWR